MRDIIERASQNDLMRQQRIEQMLGENKIQQARINELKAPTQDPAGTFMGAAIGAFKQRALDERTSAMQPEIQAMNAQRQTSLARQIDATGGINPSDFSPEQLQSMRMKQIELQSKPAASPLVSINNQVEGTRSVKSEGRRAEIIDNAFKAGETARETASQAGTIEAHLDSLVQSGGATGPAFGMLEFLNNTGAQFGIETNLNDSSDFTAIEAASNKLAVPLTKMLGVNPTDKDAAIIKSTVARAGTSMPANYALIDLTKQAAKRDLAKENLITLAEEQGLNESQMRRMLNEFHTRNPLQPAIPVPPTIAQMKVGQRYSTDKGIYQFDGENMTRVK